MSRECATADLLLAQLPRYHLIPAHRHVYGATAAMTAIFYQPPWVFPPAYGAKGTVVVVYCEDLKRPAMRLLACGETRRLVAREHEHHPRQSF
jgi:hypothetical protein